LLVASIATVVSWDLDIVDRLAVRLERSTRWGRGVGAVDLSNGFRPGTRGGEELELRIEAHNMTAVAAAATAHGGPRVGTDSEAASAPVHREGAGDRAPRRPLRVLVLVFRLDAG
jgi:hypothetical protein